MILRLLGSPCSVARNPHCPSAAPVRLYSLEKVVAAQASMAFAAATKRAAVASRRALKVHQATAQALLQTAWAVSIALPDLPEQAHRAAAEERLRGALAGQSPLPIGLEHLVAGHAVPDPARTLRAEPVFTRRSVLDLWRAACSRGRS